MKHCLIVDDSAVIRKVAKRIMEGLALRITEAEDGEAGLRLCQQEMPDAVFVDAGMPEMDGWEFLKRLRQMPGGAGPKVLFCALENDVVGKTRALRAGADAFMLKPFDRDGLAGILKAVGIA